MVMSEAYTGISETHIHKARVIYVQACQRHVHACLKHHGHVHTPGIYTQQRHVGSCTGMSGVYMFMLEACTGM